MNWEKELYVKVYLRDTPEFLAMSWQARVLFLELLRKVDRRGIMQVGKLGVRGIAVAIRAPVEEIEPPIRELLEQGRLVWREEDGHFLIPNHVRAQGAVESDAARKRKQRERERQAGEGRPGGHRAATPASGPADWVSHESGTGHAVPDGSEGTDSTQTAAAGPVSRASGPSVTCHDQIRSEEIRSEEKRSEEGRSEGESARARATLAPIDPERALTEEGRAYAATVAVSDIDRVYRDFRNHYLAEAKLSADWEALWRRWCDREQRIQRQERDRARPKAPLQLDPPDAKRGWTMPEIIYLPKGRVS